MGDSLDLATAAIHFLKQFDQSDSNKYYMRDVKYRFAAFINGFNRSHPQIQRFSLNEVLNYIKRKKYVFFVNGQMNIKPLFINTENGQTIVFSLSGSPGATVYFVCRLCDRGFTSKKGLDSHRSSTFHEQVFEGLVSRIDSFRQLHRAGYICPIIGCQNGAFADGEDLIKHWQEEKYVRVKIPSKSDQELKEAEERRRQFTCSLCRMVCSTLDSYNRHMQGWKHKANDFRKHYYNNRPVLLGNRDGIQIVMSYGDSSVEDSTLKLFGSKHSPTVIGFEVVNLGKLPIKIQSIEQFSFFDERMVSLVYQRRGLSGLVCTIPTRGNYKFDLKITAKFFGIITVPVIIVLGDLGEAGSPVVKLAREVVFICSRDYNVYKELQPLSPYRKPEKKKPDDITEIIRSDRKPEFAKNCSLMKVLPLEKYMVPMSLKQALGNMKRSQKPYTEADLVKDGFLVDLADLDFSNYSLHFRSLIHIEECQMEVDIQSYSMYSAFARKDTRTGLLKLDIPGLSENRPSVLKGDRLYAIKDGEARHYEGYVHRVELNSVDLGFYKQFSENYIDKEKVTIKFSVNRLAIKLEHRAVNWAGERTNLLKPNFSLEHSLFPSTRRFLPFYDPSKIKIECSNRDIQSNPEQLTAIKHIVCGTSRPAPYLIFGPPGTGKTNTVVEAIKQIYRHFPKAKILACAPQNAAADLLTERLLKDTIHKHDVMRLNAASRSYGDLPDKIKEVSNFRSKSGVATPLGHGLGAPSNRVDMEVYFPSKEDLMGKRVLVTTLVSAGRLASADMSKHFTHIFIDEAGHASEPETLIAIAGLLDVNLPTGGQLVLAGDPKQLGPVIRSELAKHFGLGRSMLERLMKTEEPYQRQESGSYDPTLVTKLLKSFRSHPAILEIPNLSFYDGELIACADKMKREMFCNWEELPIKGFPLIFHGISGEEKREASNPSWFNPDEIMVVVDYIEKLMDSKSPRVRADMIGVITPYHQQSVKIKRALAGLEMKQATRQRNYNTIKVGSVEMFQGDEREIIIISTVRSQETYLDDDEKFNLGFVTNKKRFNVAVTRAKALLIIVGNPDILRRCDCWKSMITHIEEGGGYTGTTAPDEIEGSLMKDLTEKIRKIRLTDEPSELQQQVTPEWQRRD